MTKHTYKHNYTYLITNNTSGMRYIGVRSCDCVPTNDNYWSSSQIVKESIQQESINNFTKQILSIYSTRIEAVAEEIFLHELYDVGVNPNYYNKVKQTSTGFDATGLSLPKSEEHKRKLSLARKGKPLSEAHKQAISRGGMGKQLTTEDKQNKSKAALKPHTRRANSLRNSGDNNPNSNKHITPEKRLAINKKISIGRLASNARRKALLK